MADHLIGKFWGLAGALAAALLALALTVPSGAKAAGPGSGALSQLASVVPAPAQSAVSAALSQVSSASGAPASGSAVPEAPPAVHVVVPSPPAVHVVVPPPPPVPAVPRPTSPSSPADFTSAAPAPLPAEVASQTGQAQSVPSPDVAIQAALSGPNSSSAARPEPALGGRTPAHRVARPHAHRRTSSVSSAAATSTLLPPVASTIAAGPWSPVSVLGTTSRRGAKPTALDHRADSPSEARRARHVAKPRPRPGSAVNTAQVALPLSAALPPGGAEGSAAGVGGAAAGAATAALLAIVGLCILRALLPGLVGLGLTPVQSALLVSRLERPG